MKFQCPIRLNSFFTNNKKTFLWIITFIGLTGLISISKFTYTQFCIHKIKQELFFNKNEHGILICQFSGEEGAKREISTEYETILLSIVNNSKLSDLKVKKIDNKLDIKVKTFESALNIGKTYNADIIIWGGVNPHGIYPHIAINHKNSKTKDEDITILKNSLRNIESNQPTDITFPALTDEPLSFSSFIVGYEYFNKKNYLEAKKYFIQSLPKSETTYVDRKKVLTYIALSEMYLGNIEEAIAVIKKHIDYKNDIYSSTLLAHLVSTEFFFKGDSKEQVSKLYSLMSNGSIDDIESLDNIFLYLIERDSILNNKRILPQDSDIESKLKEVDLPEFQIKYFSDTYVEQLFMYYMAHENKKNISELIELTENSKNKEIIRLRVISLGLLKSFDKIESELEKYIAIAGSDNFESFARLIFYGVSKNEIELSRFIESNKLKNSLFKNFIAALYYLDEKKDYTKAIEILSSLITKYHDNKSFYKYRAKAYALKGDKEKAENDYIEYLSFFQNDVEVILELETLVIDDPQKMVKYLKYMGDVTYYDIDFGKILNQFLNNEEKSPNLILQNNDIKNSIQSIILDKRKEARQSLLELLKNTGRMEVKDRYVASYAYYLLSIIALLDSNYVDASSYTAESFKLFPIKETFNGLIGFSYIEKIDEKIKTLKAIPDFNTSLYYLL
ncbi:MAG: hypothetical protein Q8R42_02515, partial [Desulfocapsaceae bacterium]|nr:hypothetical protein [Desulfocapsaceae bacterium]